MPNPTTHLGSQGLVTWVDADPFLRTDFDTNFTVLDNSPGVFLCTSTTHPLTWGTNQKGMSIIETDTLLRWTWNGTAFVRTQPLGLLQAPSTLTTDISTTSTTPVQALSATVTIPPGGRSVLLLAEIPVVQEQLTSGSGGITNIVLMRDTTSQLTEWTTQGDTVGLVASDQPRNGSGFIVDTPTAGAHTYAIYFAVVAGFAGTCWLRGSANKPIQLSVVEV